VTYGRLFIPYVGDSRWLTPLGIATILALVLLAVRCCTASRPLVDIRGWVHTAREADVRGALLLALALTGVILAFATADPKVQVFSDQGLWYLLGAALAAIGFVVHLQRSNRPLVPRGALRRTPAWGSMLVSFFIGAALVAALIDIPLFARTTVYPDSQLLAALVLVRFLVALPIGAIVGDYTAGNSAGGVGGLGYQIILTSSRFQMPQLYATAIAGCVTGFLFVAAVVGLQWLVLHRWHPDYVGNDR